MQKSIEFPKGLENRLIEMIITCTTQALKSQQSVLKEWFSLSEAAQYAGVSHNTFVKFRQMGLKICEIDGIKRVSRKEIDRFFEDYSF
ncbi:DNA-binding protein [Sporosarcina sp. FSL K6-5500]|uniref:DNA-binding protein n=1 Tax=Sporosarcina sp. FSL K6-5500 TaxID=2921558 RepID=UPI0030FC62AC